MCSFSEKNRGKCLNYFEIHNFFYLIPIHKYWISEKCRNIYFSCMLYELCSMADNNSHLSWPWALWVCFTTGVVPMRLCWICDLVKRHHAAKAMFCFKMFWCNAPIRSQRSGTRAQLEPRPCTAGRAAALRGTHTPAFHDYTVTSREKNRNDLLDTTLAGQSHNLCERIVNRIWKWAEVQLTNVLTNIRRPLVCELDLIIWTFCFKSAGLCEVSG